ncbi:MAG: hypothetical protein ABIJ75_11795, partial [Actinomycetota bacterium]
ILRHGETMVVNAAPSEAVRCIVEGYFLADVAGFARKGAGSMDEAYASDGAIEVKDTPLAKLTYLTLVELKRIRTILETEASNGIPTNIGWTDRDFADEIAREMES